MPSTSSDEWDYGISTPNPTHSAGCRGSPIDVVAIWYDPGSGLALQELPREALVPPVQSPMLSSKPTAALLNFPLLPPPSRLSLGSQKSRMLVVPPRLRELSPQVTKSTPTTQILSGTTFAMDTDLCQPKGKHKLSEVDQLIDYLLP